MDCQVSLTKSQDSHSGVQKALEPIIADLKKALAKTSRVVVKINFVSAYTELATTPLESVKAFIDSIQNFYQGEIIVAEEATLGNSDGGFHRFGFTELSQNPKVKLLDSVNSPTERATIKYPQGELVLPLAEIYTQSPFIASICRAKTHDAVVATLSIKNLLVGAIQQKPFSNRAKIHQGKQIHWILAEIAKHTFPNLAIIDGTVGMEGNGPCSGTPINSGWTIASLDPLAADSLAAYLMGFKIEDIGYLNLIREKGLGLLYPKDKIKILGEDPKNLITPYRPHDTFESQRRWKE